VSRISNPRIIAVIPARGGSKSVPRKNLKLLDGHPLISYSIGTAMDSKYIDEVYVSTEDPEIMSVAKSYGADVVERPIDLASDSSRDGELLQHLIDRLHLGLENEDIIVFLRPTHPLRNPSTVDRAIDIFKNANGFDSLRSMKVSKEIPFKMFEIVDGNMARPLFESSPNGVHDPINAPRQQLPVVYAGDAYVDIFKVSTVREFGNTTGLKILPFVVTEFSQDIDTFDDFSMVTNYIRDNQIPNWFNYPKKLY
jgi:N-acylneuraminate cytidylyltransferase